MSAYLFYAPRYRPLTAAGAIMPGAYMQFYLTGTTTPEDVFADAELTTPLDNPVEADASGKFPPIYMNPLVTYRVQLFNAADVLQDDVDPYLPPRDYPPRTVLMFCGTEEQLEAAYPPDLWQQMDGTNGTYDMRGRFPIMPDGTINAGSTGGSFNAVNTSAAGAHDHGGAVSDESLSIAQMPEHRHDLLGTTGGGITDTSITASNARGIGAVRNNTSGPYVTSTDPGDEYVDTEGDGDPHSHDIEAASDHTHSVTATPPYCGIWFIMRRAA